VSNVTDTGLTLSGNIPSGIGPGTVLVIGKAPGLLRKVVTVRSSRNGAMDLETIQANLEDVFQQWEVEESHTLKPAELQLSNLAPGVTVETRTGRPDLPVARLKLTDVTIDDGLKADGEIEVQTRIDIGCRIRWGHLERFSFIQTQTVTSSVTIKAAAKKTFYEKRFSLCHVEGAPIMISAWPPVWITPALDFNIRPEGSIEAGVQAKCTGSITTRTGAVYENGSWRSIGECDQPQFTSPLNDFGPYLAMSFKVSVPEIQLGLKIMSVAGPFVGIDCPYFQSSLELLHLQDPIPTAKVDLTVGVGARIGVYVQILSSTLASEDWDIPLVAEFSLPTFPREIPLGGNGSITVRSLAVGANPVRPPVRRGGMR